MVPHPRQPGVRAPRPGRGPARAFRLTAVPALFAFLATLLVLEQRPVPARAGTAARLELEQLVDHAELVLEARVVAATPRLDAVGRVETELLLAVDRTFVGEDLALRSVRVPGGVLPDGRGMLVAGLPRLETGEEALLFFSAEGSTGWRMPVGLAQGVLRIRRPAPGRVVLVGDETGLGLANPGGGGLGESRGRRVLDYAAVVAELEALAAGREARRAARGVPEHDR